MPKSLGNSAVSKQNNQGSQTDEKCILSGKVTLNKPVLRWIAQYQRAARCLKYGEELPLVTVKWMSMERRNLEMGNPKKRSEDQIRLLNNLGIRYDGHTHQWLLWKKRYDEFAEFLQTVHRYPSRSKERSLYTWQRLMLEKLRKKELDEEQVELLRRVGIKNDER